MTYSLDTLDPEHSHAVPLRLARLDRLEKAVADARFRCVQHQPVCGAAAGCELPGCAALHELIGQRAALSGAWKQGTDPKSWSAVTIARSSAAAVDALLEATARRVRAHDYCLARAHDPDTACTALAAAERSFEPPPLGDAVAPARFDIVPSTLLKNREKALSEHEEQLREAVITRQESFYAGSVPRHELPASLAVRMDPVVQRVQAPPAGEHRSGPEVLSNADLSLLSKAFEPERSWLASSDNACASADLLIRQDGSVVPSTWTRLTPPATICVDTTELALDRPIHVRLHGRSEQRLAGFVGEVLAIDNSLVDADDVMRVEVSGAARGRALRALVRQFNQYVRKEGTASGSSGAAVPLPDGVTDGTIESLVLSSIKVSRDRLELEGGLARKEAVRRLALALTQLRGADGYLQAHAAVLVDVLKPDGKLDGPAKVQTALDHAAGTITPLLARTVEQATAWEEGEVRLGELPESAITDAYRAFIRSLPSLADRLTPNDAAHVYEVVSILSRMQADLTTLSAAPSEYANKRALLLQQEHFLRSRAGEFCQLGQRYTRVLSDDVIVNGVAQVLRFEFGRGYVGSSFETREPRDEAPVYVEVSGMPATTSVAVAVGDHPVAAAVPRLSGGDAPAASAGPAEQPAFGAMPLADELAAALDPAQQPSTYVARVGRLDGGYAYDIAVCETSTRQKSTCAAESSRVIGQQRLRVHGKSYLNLRIGIGATMTHGDRVVPVRAGGEAGQWVVAKVTDTTPSVSLPLLLSVYPSGRDLQSSGLSPNWAVGAGVDLHAPTTTLIPASLTLEPTPGIGLTLGLTVTSTSVPRAPVGSTTTSTTTPDLASVFGAETQWRWGGFAGLSLDLNLFRVTFSNVYDNITSKLPSPKNG